MVKKLIIANWKANPSTAKEAEDLFYFYNDIYSEMSEKIDLVVCPPYVYLQELSRIKGNIVLGAEDISWEESVGPYTGEVTSDMLKNLGVKYVLAGHSERRYGIGESDYKINKKVKSALSADITPVLLIGERDKTDDRNKVLEDQLTAALEGLGPEDTPDNAVDALGIIKNFIFSRYRLGPDEYRLIYGGSIGEANVTDFLRHDEIGGAVIGGASIRKDEFANILKIVNSL